MTNETNETNETEEKKTFRDGDVVRLRSGGPAMTVYDDSDQVEIGCTWWREEDGEYRTECFSAAELIAVPMPPGYTMVAGVDDGPFPKAVGS